MITNDSLAHFIQSLIPDAKVSITDKTGTMDHFYDSCGIAAI